ncbi:MAG: hypothetical protein EA378_04995 [Phycisphaerales bacterium]|nr:MAG: hypothetical protein EA378_04995 [Phycisphaerales bacterium]
MPMLASSLVSRPAGSRGGRLVRIAFAIGAAAMLTGCANRMFQVEMSGEAPPEGTPISVVVRGEHANVLLTTDHRVEAPTLKARADGARRGAVHMPADLGYVRADLTHDGESGYTLEIEIDRAPQRDLAAGPSTVTLRTPAIGDVRVRNHGGYVHVSGASGAIDIQNGVGGEGGNVRVRTDAPIDRDVRMETTDGQVTLSIPQDAKGTLEVSAPRGKPTIDARTVALEAFRPMPAERVWLAVLNGGENRIYLRTGRGNARINIVTEPMRTSFFQPFIETAPD